MEAAVDHIRVALASAGRGPRRTAGAWWDARVCCYVSTRDGLPITSSVLAIADDA
jgi:hypothetical protein